MEVIRPEGGKALRILRHPGTLLALGFVAFMVLYGLTGMAASVKSLRNTPLQAGITLLMAALGIGLYKLFQRKVEGRADAEFSLPRSGRELAEGLAGGFLTFSIVALTVAALGGLSICGIDGFGRFWSVLSLAIASGVYEEIVFRGVAFRHIETMLGSWGALAITSAFFGLAHIANPGATWFAAFAIAVEAGIMLGAAYMLTRRLWLAVGIHAGWNFTQGWVFSVPVSGGKPMPGLLKTAATGSEWLTGGAFGLEASVVALVVATLVGLMLLGMALQRGRLVKPRWVK